MATQQPPVRPWFRLASMAAPSPAPQANPLRHPRPTFTRPALIRPTPLPPQQSAPAPRSPPTAVAPTPAIRSPPSTVAPPPALPPQSSPTNIALTPAPRSPPIVVAAPPQPRSPPTAVAPTPVSATPRTSPTAVNPSPPPPTAGRLPATPIPSSVKTSFIIPTSPLSLSPISAAPTASPTPTVLPLPSSNPIQQSPNLKVSSPFSPLENYGALKQQSPIPAPPSSPYQTVPTTVSSKFINPQSNSPSLSPQIRPVFHPPSPLTLPPAQLKSERETIIPQEIQQRNVIVQETKEKPRVPHKNSNSNHLSQYNGELYQTTNLHNGKREPNEHFKDKGNNVERDSYEDLGMSVLTISGDNKGAIMELSPKKKYESGINNPQSLHKNSVYKTLCEEDKSGGDSSSSNKEGQSRTKDKNHNVMTQPKTTYMNSNVQGVNNSVLYNGSYTHHDPGVRLLFSRAATGSGRFA